MRRPGWATRGTASRKMQRNGESRLYVAAVAVVSLSFDKGTPGNVTPPALSGRGE